MFPRRIAGRIRLTEIFGAEILNGIQEIKGTPKLARSR